MSIDELLERASDEADLCRNDGADDIAELLDEAAATIRALREALASIMSQLDNGRNAPGHGHVVSGVWDNDISNGDKAGQPCEWCARWSSARAALEASHGRAG